MKTGARRVVWSLVVVLLLGVPIIVRLAGTVPNTIDTDTGRRDPRWISHTVEMDSRPWSDGSRLVGARLDFDATETLAQYSELWLFMDSSGAATTVLQGELQIYGTNCIYWATPGKTLANRQYVVFQRARECGEALTGRAIGQLDLRMVVRGGSRLGLVTSHAPAATPVDPGWIVYNKPAREAGDPFGVVWARYADSYVGGEHRRVDLLNYVWQLSQSAGWLWAIVGLALLLVGVGTYFCSPDKTADKTSPGETSPGETSPREVFREPARENLSGRGFSLASGVAAVGLGLALLYVVLVPPFQAPDEPDLFLGFAQLVDRPQLAEQAATLARIGHVDEILFRSDVHFRPFEVGRPLDRPWPTDEVFAHRIDERSVTESIWWRGLGHLLSSLDAPGCLLALRLANAVLFALVLGAATALLLVIAGSRITAPHAVCLALLAIPTLPFFAVLATDFSILTSTHVLVTAIVVGMFFDVPRSYLLGLPFGIGCALLLLSGRSAHPLVIALAFLLIGRAILGAANVRQAARGGEAGQDTPDANDAPAGAHGRRRSLVFWGGLGIGLALFPLLATRLYLTSLVPPGNANVPEWLTSIADLARRFPWMLIAIAPLGFLAERFFAAIRRRLGQSGRATGNVVRAVACTFAALVFLSLIVSLFVRYPLLGGIERQTAMSMRGYASAVGRVVATGFRLVNHDLWMSSSFWGGFGWIDAVPGEWFISLLVLIAAAGVIGAMLRVARARDGRWLGRFTLLMIGWALSLTAYAVSALYLQRILHGRYVFGLYLLVLGVCWSVVALVPRVHLAGRFERAGITRERLLLALVAGLHAFSLCFILQRYY